MERIGSNKRMADSFLVAEVARLQARRERPPNPCEFGYKVFVIDRDLDLPS
jgi:hypothetical protein